MPSGNMVSSNKMQFPAHAGVGEWFPDDHDGFIYWLRGEFAAANAMIDSLCHHLREIGEIGEYEAVIASIQQRRYIWNPVLHMQQYFPVTDVSYALQQAAWRRRQRLFDQVKVGGKESKENKRSGFGFKGNRIELVAKEVQKNSMVDCDVDSTVFSTVSKRLAENKGSIITENKTDNNDPSQNQNKRQNFAISSKTFVANEIFDGKMVNVVDGLKLFEELFDKKEVFNLVSLVNDLRAAGRKGQLQGQTYVTSEKPVKGHGREMIQLGLPIADAPLDDETALRTSADRGTEAIPSLLQVAIEHLVDLQVLPTMPDSCIIDVYNEGDHSKPRTLLPWFGKPVGLMFLTECEITFGRVIAVDHPGDFQGSLKLSLSPGSLLVLEGKSADFAKHALPSVQKQRVLVTFIKYKPKKYVFDNQKLPSPSISQRGLPPCRSPNRFRHSASPKYSASIPATGVLPAPLPTPPSNGVFVPAPVSIPPRSTVWSTTPAPHLPVPGTGFFLPPGGSGNPSPQQLPTSVTELSISIDTTFPMEKDNGSRKANHSATSPGARLDKNCPNRDSSESLDGIGSGRAATKDEQSPDNISVNQSC